MPNAVVFPGARFGRLTVLSRQKTKTAVLCDCGVQKTVASTNLTAGRIRSCGCLNREVQRQIRLRHGESYGQPGHSAEYRCWQKVHERCENPRARSYPDYGGRGIRVCERWATFENFLADMGRRPIRSMSIERLNSNGNYEPDNCQWATSTAQNRNRRNTLQLTLNGKTASLAEWAEKIGVKYFTLHSRFKRSGWSQSYMQDYIARVCPTL